MSGRCEDTFSLFLDIISLQPTNLHIHSLTLNGVSNPTTKHEDHIILVLLNFSHIKIKVALKLPCCFLSLTNIKYGDNLLCLYQLGMSKQLSFLYRPNTFPTNQNIKRFIILLSNLEKVALSLSGVNHASAAHYQSFSLTEFQ